METMSLEGRTILLAGATSAAGAAAARTALDRGARVIAVGRDAERLAAIPATRREAFDLTDAAAATDLADLLHTDGIHVDGVLHLVGGWRGGGGLAGQTDDDYRFLEASLTALRHVSRAFDADLRASDVGRLAIVSSTAVARPLAGGANYAAVKAASEAWTRAVAQGFAKAARDAAEPLRAASVVFRVKALQGLEQTLADAFADLFDTDAADINDRIITLESPENPTN